MLKILFEHYEALTKNPPQSLRNMITDGKRKIDSEAGRRIRDIKNLKKEIEHSMMERLANDYAPWKAIKRKQRLQEGTIPYQGRLR